jgi:hypothetical protein
MICLGIESTAHPAEYYPPVGLLGTQVDLLQLIKQNQWG